MAWDLVLVGMVCYVGLETGRVFACLLAYLLAIVVVVQFGFVCVCVGGICFGDLTYIWQLSFLLFLLGGVWEREREKWQFGSIKRRISYGLKIMVPAKWKRK